MVEPLRSDRSTFTFAGTAAPSSSVTKTPVASTVQPAAKSPVAPLQKTRTKRSRPKTGRSAGINRLSQRSAKAVGGNARVERGAGRDARRGADGHEADRGPEPPTLVDGGRRRRYFVARRDQGGR